MPTLYVQASRLSRLNGCGADLSLNPLVLGAQPMDGASMPSLQLESSPVEPLAPEAVDTTEEFGRVEVALD